MNAIQQNSRPLIGLACMNVADRRGSMLIGHRPTYVQAIEAAGGVPLLIYLTDDQDTIRVLYEQCQGIMLPGGDDVDPALFGEQRHPQLGNVDPQRDAVEFWLSRWSRQDRKPLFGICRGTQVINAAFGGTLYQDIPSQIPNALDHYASSKHQQWDYLAHAAKLTADSWLAEQLGASNIMINTIHHQSVKAVAPGLRATGHAPDGVIEMIEGTEDQFVLGVQGHPEHLWRPHDSVWRRVFAAFVALCTR